MHVIYMKFTEAGAHNLDDALEALEAVQADLFTALDIREVSLLLTMGQHDLVTVFEAEDPHIAAFYSLELAHSGYFRTETVCGFEREDFKAAVQQIKLTRGRVS